MTSRKNILIFSLILIFSVALACYKSLTSWSSARYVYTEQGYRIPANDNKELDASRNIAALKQVNFKNFFESSKIFVNTEKQTLTFKLIEQVDSISRNDPNLYRFFDVYQKAIFTFAPAGQFDSSNAKASAELKITLSLSCNHNNTINFGNKRRSKLDRVCTKVLNLSKFSKDTQIVTDDYSIELFGQRKDPKQTAWDWVSVSYQPFDPSSFDEYTKFRSEILDSEDLNKFDFKLSK